MRHEVERFLATLIDGARPKAADVRTAEGPLRARPGCRPGAGDGQVSSGTIVIAPAGHSAAQRPQPLQ